METVNIVLCGLGGQGILFMTKVLARAALDQGLDIMGAETHGMAQRGGSVVSHLRFGDVESSLVRSGTARFLLALDADEAYRNLPFLSENGRLYVNALEPGFPVPEVQRYLDSRRAVCRAFPAEKTAAVLGAPMSANLALLGFYSAFEDSPVSTDAIEKTIRDVSPERFREINLAVFRSGFERGRRMGAGLAGR